MSIFIGIGNYSSIISKKDIKLNINYDNHSDYTIIDVETTGLSAEWDEIIQVAALKIRNNEIISKFETLVKPNNEIDEYITELTGITNEMVQNAPKINDIVSNLFDFIDNDIICGHNVRFDIRFLNNISEQYTITDRKYIDTLFIARKVFPNERHHKLENLVTLLDINTPQKYHNALDDCLTTFYVYRKLMEYSLNNKIDLQPKSKTYINLSSITPTNQNSFDEESLFYNKYVCFTGILEKMQRKEAAQIIVNIGGFITDSVTKQTNFLILGNNDYCKLIKDGKSAKHKKALLLKTKGQDIEIISENEFYDQLQIQ